MNRLLIPTVLVATLLASAAMLAPLTALAAIASSTENAVRAYFADIPVMTAIAQCESGFTQFTRKGAVLHGGFKHHMIGIFQIAAFHAREAKQLLGANINTVDGNMEYARYLYEQNGTDPWLDSATCWQPLIQESASTTASALDIGPKLALIEREIASAQAILAHLR